MKSGIRNKRFLKQWNIPIVLLIFFSTFLAFQSQASVRPDLLASPIIPDDIFNVETGNTRNFASKDHTPALPVFPVQPVKQSDQDEDRCIVKENFRIYADRGQDPALLVFYGVFIGYPSGSGSVFYDLPFVFISSQFSCSSRIRPPPVI